MGERTSYEPGTFCWVDLAAPDQDAAKAFYMGLLGWECEDLPMGDDGVYSMMSVGGKDVAAIAPQPSQMSGLPPIWSSYVSVPDADAATAKAKQAGATVVSEPFDVFTAGRMTILQDPQGAAFMLWQARDRIGASLVNAPGALTLNQLNTTDPEAAAAFYAEVFGWTTELMGDTDQPYWGIYNGGNLNGGMMRLAPGQDAPPHWLTYFATADLEGAVAQVRSTGGQIVLPPMPVPEGRIIVATDPQGGFFALWEGQLDP